MTNEEPIISGKYLMQFYRKVISKEYLPVFIYFLAFIVRLIFLLDTGHKPLFNTLVGDPAYYDAWAMQITGGDLVGKSVWEMSPLYPYLLAFIYKLFGHGYLLVKFLQAIIGSSTCLLIFFVGQKLFSRPAGLIAALLAIFTGPLIFYDGLIMKTSLGVFLITLFLYLVILASRNELGRKVYVWVGIEFGLLCLVRENAVLLIIVFMAVLLNSYMLKKTTREQAVNLGLLFLLGAAIIILPVTVRNYYMGKDFVLITSKYGETFYEGNNPDADGTYSPPDFVRPDPFYEHADFTAKAEEIKGRSLKPSQVSNFWLLQGVKYIARNPVKWAGVQLKKTRYLLNTYEGPDNYDYNFSKKFSVLLRLPLITFGIIGPFALVGMLLGIGKFKYSYPLYVYIAIYAFSLLVFFIFSRFRLYMVPALIVFAGYGLFRIGSMIREKDIKGLLKPGLVLCVFLVVFHLPVKRQSFTGSYNSLGCIYSKNGLNTEAVDFFEKAIEIDSEMPALWYNLGNSYNKLSKEAEAGKEPEDKTNELYGKAHRFMGIAYFKSNKLENAWEEFMLSLDYFPDNADTISYAGITGFYLKKYQEAEKYLKKSLDMNPELHENIKALAMIYEKDETVKAISMWETYLKNTPDLAEYVDEKKLIVKRISELKGRAGK